MLEEWNTRLFASNINKQQQQRQPTNEGGVKYTFVWFQEQQQQIATINSKKLWEWITLLFVSNINKQKAKKTTTTYNRSHAGGVLCTFVSSRLNIFRLRHHPANVLFILARLKDDNKKIRREKTSNVFLPLLLGFPYDKTNCERDVWDVGINQKNSASCIIRAFERVALLENMKLNKLPLSEFQKISEDSVFAVAWLSLNFIL